MLDIIITYALWLGGGVLWLGGGLWSTAKIVADLSGVVYAGRVAARVVRRRLRKVREDALPFAEEIREPVTLSEKFGRAVHELHRLEAGR